MTRRRFALVACCFGAATPAVAQSIGNSGDPPPLSITTAVAGFDLTPASNATTTLSVTTSAANQRIVAHRACSLPAGTTLSISITAPSGATPLGTVTLDTFDKNVVTGIPVGTYSNLTITYTLSSTVTSATLSTTVCPVTISLADPP